MISAALDILHEGIVRYSESRGTRDAVGASTKIHAIKAPVKALLNAFLRIQQDAMSLDIRYTWHLSPIRKHDTRVRH